MCVPLQGSLFRNRPSDGWTLVYELPLKFVHDELSLFVLGPTFPFSLCYFYSPMQSCPFPPSVLLDKMKLILLTPCVRFPSLIQLVDFHHICIPNSSALNMCTMCTLLPVKFQEGLLKRNYYNLHVCQNILRKATSDKFTFSVSQCIRCS